MQCHMDTTAEGNSSRGQHDGTPRVLLDCRGHRTSGESKHTPFGSLRFSPPQRRHHFILKTGKQLSKTLRRNCVAAAPDMPHLHLPRTLLWIRLHARVHNQGQCRSTPREHQKMRWEPTPHHTTTQALDKFAATHGRMPAAGSAEDAAALVALTKELNAASKEPLEELDDGAFPSRLAPAGCCAPLPRSASVPPSCRCRCSLSLLSWYAEP